LLAHRGDVMTGGTQQAGAAFSEILVKLEIQATWLKGTGTMRSRDISAP
jgi:hypothetical protein